MKEEIFETFEERARELVIEAFGRDMGLDFFRDFNNLHDVFEKMKEIVKKDNKK